MKKFYLFILVLTVILVCPLSVSAEASDYSKFSGDIFEKFPVMSDDESATVLLYLTYDKGYTYDVNEEEHQALFEQREADNKAFLERYTSIADKDILYVSKYQRQVAVNATKAELTRFWCDSEVKGITDFEMNLGFSNDITGADVKYALDEYMASKKAIDEASAHLIGVGESGDVPLIQYTILPTNDEVRNLRFQNYIFVSHANNACYHLGFFAMIDGTFVPFEEALEKKFVNIDDAAEVFNTTYKIENLGDMNNDGNLNIKDATYFQKALAGLVKIPKITFDFEDFRDYDVTDFNGDGELNIRDVTDIQKHLAKIEI